MASSALALLMVGEYQRGATRKNQAHSSGFDDCKSLLQQAQHASKDYRKLIAQYHLTQSMSRRCNCWDNVVTERFFATLKKQAVHGECFSIR